MTTASKITLVRVLMIPVFMALLLMGHNIVALVVFIVASCTDFVDGYIARHYNQVSNFGKFLDPLADKLLVISCMVIFIQWGRMPAWAVMIVLTREFAVTGRGWWLWKMGGLLPPPGWEKSRRLVPWWDFALCCVSPVGWCWIGSSRLCWSLPHWCPGLNTS